MRVKGECKAKVKVNKQVIKATFVAVDVPTHYPLFGRDWMLLLGLDVATVIMEATKIHNMHEETVGSSPEQLFKEYLEVFKLEYCKELKHRCHMQLQSFANPDQYYLL